MPIIHEHAGSVKFGDGVDPWHETSYVRVTPMLLRHGNGVQLLSVLSKEDREMHELHNAWRVVRAERSEWSEYQQQYKPRGPGP